MNPYFVEESQARYQERVDAAEAWRLEQTARVDQGMVRTARLSAS